jgi:hypothetical protein
MQRRKGAKVKTEEKGNSRKKAQKAQKGWDRENNGARTATAGLRRSRRNAKSAKNKNRRQTLVYADQTA